LLACDFYAKGYTKHNDSVSLQEFELWKNSLTEDERQEATGFFSVIKRHSEKSSYATGNSGSNHTLAPSHDLYYVPYSHEYSSDLTEASELLWRASKLTSSLR